MSPSAPATAAIKPTKNRPARPYWPIGFFLLLSASIAATWYSATTAQEAAVLRERGRELQAIAELKIGFIHFWLEERRADAAVQGKMPLMARIAEHGAPRTGPDSADVVRDRLDVFREAYGYEAVLLLDSKARYRAWAGPVEEYVSPPASDPARAAMESGRTVVSRAYRSKENERHHPDIDIATPVFAGGRDRWRIVGALVFHLDPLQHLDPMLQQWPASSASGETVLVEQSGDEVIFLSTLRHADAALLRKSVAEDTLPAAIAARGQRGVTEGLDYRGVPVLAAVDQVPDMPWYVIAKIDRDEILAPARREARRSGALAALLVLALGLATLFWWRRGQSELVLARQAAAEQALRTSESRSRKLLEHSWDFHALFDRDMVIRYSSPSVSRLLGHEATGQEIGVGTARVHPDDVARVEEARQAALKQPGVPQPVEHRLMRNEGGWLTVEAYFTNHFDDPDIESLSYTARDISERKQAEAALRESEQRFRALFERAPIGISIAGPDRRYLMVNPAQCRLLGYSEAELLRMRYTDVTHPDDLKLNVEKVDTLLAGRADHFSMEKRYIRKNGEIVWTSLNVVAVCDANGDTLYTIGLSEDITERREAEGKRLAFARQQRDALVQEVHHRIKNHLQGLAGLLRRHMAQQPALQPVLEAFAAQINAISVVHGLQGRTENGKASLRGLAAEIATFLGGITGVPLKLELPEHECRWAVAEDESVPVALIVNELLTNALRHRAGGNDPASATPVSLGIRCNANGARLTIRNPGRLAPEVDFAGGQGLGTGLGLIRALLPPSGITVSLSNAPDGSVEAQIDLSSPILMPMVPDHVVSRR